MTKQLSELTRRLLKEQLAADRPQAAPVDDPRKFILAGNAVFTLRNDETGNRFTFKVKVIDREDEPDKFFVSVLNGPDNWANYAYLGLIDRDIFRLTKKSAAPEGQSTQAFAWLWNRLKNPAPLPWNIRIFHEGKCGRCGRRLTVPESIESGYGPECIGLV